MDFFVCALLLISVVFALVGVLWLTFALTRSRRFYKLSGKHVLVTGGSSGIGLAIAKDLARKGAFVSILARNQEKLDKAVEECLAPSSPSLGKVKAVSIDVAKMSEASIYATVKAASFEDFGQVDAVINCAGTAIAGKVLDLPYETYTKLMDLNFLGAVKVTRAFIGDMIKGGVGGRVLFISSMAGQVGLFGYTAYSPTKFAIQGFAQAISMELSPHDIFVGVAYPPDTDTPGYAVENQSKPRETKMLEEAGGLWKPQDIAKKCIKAVEYGDCSVYFGLEGWMLHVLTCGFEPIPKNFPDFSAQICPLLPLMTIFRIVAVCYQASFTATIKKEHSKMRDMATASSSGSGSSSGRSSDNSGKDD